MSDNAEARLAGYVVEWLTSQHWEVYQEVKFGYGGIADIAAVRAGLLWVIECKTSLTFRVLEQASGWGVHFRSVAVPKARGDTRLFASHIAHQYLRLGILEVDGLSIRERYAAPLMREHHTQARRFMAGLREEQKTWCAAGSSSGGYYTPYRDTMQKVKWFIAAHPGCTLKEIMDDVGKGHYSSTASAKSCIPKALRDWEKDWCTIEKADNQVRFFVKSGMTRR